MATNQRENERKERKEKKQHRAALIFWCCILVVVAILLVMKICEIDFAQLKKQLSGSASVSQSVSDDEKFPFALDGSEDALIYPFGNKIAALSSSSFYVVDSADAELMYSDEHGYSNPIIKINGSYSVIFDQGSNKYRLDTAGGNIYSDTAENTILCVDVSASGTVALATTSSEARSELLVYSKSLNEKLRYSVSSGYVTDIAVDNAANRIAFAVVSSENAKLQTAVYLMNINDNEPKSEFIYPSSVLDIRFSGSKLYIVGTDFVSIISSMKNEQAVFEKGSINVSSFAYNSSDSLVLSYAEYTGEASDKIVLIQPSGKIKINIETGGSVKDIAASSSVVSVLTDGMVISYSLKNGEVINRLDVDDSYSSVVQLSSKIFAKHRSYIELLTDQ